MFLKDSVMKKKSVLFMLLFAGSVLFIILLMQPAEIHYAGNIPILHPQGIIAFRERNLLLIIQVLMLLVVIPVYILTFIFSWKYRSQNSKAKYEPHLEDNVIAEIIWWGLPFVLIIIIGTLTWFATFELDPFKPIPSDKKPLRIQVVALQWKWLFIYPEEKIASVNFVQIPAKTPIVFEITADAPMNSLWIPQLAGQIYAMPGARTKLNLISDKTGEFRGVSANLSGEGFAGMHFMTKASTEEEFQRWQQAAKESQNTLNLKEYNQLALPSSNNPVAIYQLGEVDLFDQIMMKYMHPQPTNE
jgi:cytochrome o ubiquinol oxidase subunit 2